MTLKQQLTDKQRIEFMKQIEFFYEINHPKWGRLFMFSFLKGIATGVGVFIGGTIVVAVLLWVLSGLGHIPFLGNITDSARETLQQGGN